MKRRSFLKALSLLPFVKPVEVKDEPASDDTKWLDHGVYNREILRQRFCGYDRVVYIRPDGSLLVHNDKEQHLGYVLGVNPQTGVATVSVDEWQPGGGSF